MEVVETSVALGSSGVCDTAIIPLIACWSPANLISDTHWIPHSNRERRLRTAVLCRRATIGSKHSPTSCSTGVCHAYDQASLLHNSLQSCIGTIARVNHCARDAPRFLLSLTQVAAKMLVWNMQSGLCMDLDVGHWHASSPLLIATLTCMSAARVVHNCEYPLDRVM